MTRVHLLPAIALLATLPLARADEPAATPSAQAEALTPETAAALAEEAYVFGFAIVENYKAIFGMCVFEKSPQFSGFNQFLHARQLFGPDYKTVVSPNNDTLYSTTWADLRNEPLVIEVPPTGDRYFVIQLVDLFTDNFAYLGTRETGRDGGTYLLVGPSYRGAIPEDKFDRVIVSRSHFVALATRTAVSGQDDLAAAGEIQDGLKLSPMSAFLGEDAPPSAPAVEFPVYNQQALYGKPAVFPLLNQFLTWQQPRLEEAALMDRLARIDVGPGRDFDLASFPPEIRAAIEQGTASGHAKIEARGNNMGEIIEGWSYSPPMGDFGTDYLFRDAVAWKFIYTNSPEEAMYPIAEQDANGDPLSGAERYVLHFPAGQLPPVDAFWSMTMYHSDTRLMVENPIDRYSIGDRTQGLQKNDDGSLTLLLQHEDPGEGKRANWLPAPDDRFYIVCRMYMPQQPALDGSYRLPPIKKQP